jgi:hypothetical protein
VIELRVLAVNACRSPSITIVTAVVVTRVNNPACAAAAHIGEGWVCAAEP